MNEIKTFVVSIRHEHDDFTALDNKVLNQRIYYAVEDYIRERSPKPYRFEIEVIPR